MSEKTSRATVFVEVRDKLTLNLLSSEQIEGLGSLTDGLEIENQQGYSEAHAHLDELLSPLFSKDVLAKPETKAMIEAVAKVYYGLGEQLAPFYVGMVDWVHKKIQELEQVHAGQLDPVIVFEGRDSLAFLATYAKLHPKDGYKWMYSRGNRRSLNGFYTFKDGKKRQELADQQKEDVLDWYGRKELAGKDVFFVDFGFAGTLPRLERMILADEEADAPRNVVVFLALLMNERDTNLFDKGKLDGRVFAKSEKELDAVDKAKGRKNLIGYLNTKSFSNTADFDFITWGKESDSNFLKVLQELGSYIRESRDQAFKPIDQQEVEGGNFVIDSAFGIVAKYMFMRGLLGKDFSQVDAHPSTIIEVLNRYYAQYKQHPHIYGLVGDLDIQTENEAINSIYDDMNKKFEQTGYPKVKKF
jgi:hypothetical protein